MNKQRCFKDMNIGEFEVVAKSKPAGGKDLAVAISTDPQHTIDISTL